MWLANPAAPQAKRVLRPLWEGCVMQRGGAGGSGGVDIGVEVQEGLDGLLGEPPATAWQCFLTTPNSPRNTMLL